MTAVKIKDGDYGKAIGLLLEMGGSFQTRFERTLIVNGRQRRALETAGFVEESEPKKKAGQTGGKTQE